MKLLAPAIIAGLLLGGCTWEARQAQQQALYVGKPYDALFSEYGAPIAVVTTSDGGKFAEFSYIKGQYSCDAKVWITPAGIVRQIKVGGQNGCVAP